MPIPALLAPLLGTLAEKGLSLLGNAILAKGRDVIEEKLGVNIEQAVQTEEGLLKLKQLEMDHQEFLIQAELEKAKLDIEEQRLDIENTKGAQTMNIKIQESEHASPLAKNAAYVLDFIIVGATLFMMIVLFFKGVPAENKEFFYMALGSLLTMCVTVVNFHRGSSSRSASKDATIAALSKGAV